MGNGCEFEIYTNAKAVGAIPLSILSYLKSTTRYIPALF